jgi:hypothetical protein
MRASLIMKLVAHVSSSISNTDAPSSSASCMQQMQQMEHSQLSHHHTQECI